ncbi:RebB family R body protein [Mucilaginibacter sp. L3T2-6]|uniref:RebB family R body protein n=1 Tax=Mucilaginibacter sp. L3T2-6 TaxID=3062491 RepID=UPI0026756D02|nr:RebB family R body protein [Mucilaginibacter sp. L3T2-6]MDO3641448.1 RebB family R body protein [Mucilaginibacter sp. L3T2-6]MDV6213791.1 RebB family R body protein [Mucilaginibacter sp. L3T2-6]
MSDSTNTLPEQIIETSRAFTETLEMENRVFQAQLNGAVAMTVEALKELIGLCKEAVAIGHTAKIAQGQQNLAKTARQALSDVQNVKTQSASVASASAADALPATTITDAVLDEAVLHAVALSYQNAVTAQQQAYITQQAATTQVIATILSVATATLGVAVKEAETETSPGQ